MTPMDSGETVYGKQVSELQTGVQVEGTEITGTLNYVTGYTGFNSSQVEEQSGNYLALDFNAEPFPSSLTVELVGGSKGPVTLTNEDHFCVFLVKATTQSIKVTADGSSTTYTLTGLTLTPQE